MQRSRGARVAAVCVTVTGLALLGACGGGGTTSSPTATTAAPAAAAQPTADGVERPDCLSASTSVAAVGAAPTTVAWRGTGTRGVLLAPQNHGDVCQWSAQLDRLADAGYLVATFTWSVPGHDALTAAADKLHQLGAQQVALVGASKGGAYVAAYAAELHAATVVALSPPAVFDHADARSAASTYTGPLLVIASEKDTDVPATESAEVARSADPASFVVVPGTAHGVSILAGPQSARVTGLIDDALRTAFAGTA